MSLIWADGFDHYGAQSEVAKEYSGAFTFNSGASARTGLGYVSLDVYYNRMQRVLNTNIPALGVGVGFNMTTAIDGHGIKFTQANAAEISFAINASRGITLFVGGTNVGASLNNVFTLGNWNHLEVYATRGASNGNGYMAARINGIVVVTASGLSMGVSDFNIFQLGLWGSYSGSMFMLYDDLVAWDTLGTVNNSFLGDRRCVTSFATANGTLQNWTFSGGATAWQSINSVPPGANYIEGALAGDVSEFAKGGLTVLATGVAGVRLVASALKTDAGAATIALGIKSGSFVTNTAAITPGTTAGYISGIIENDPNGSVPFTKTTYEAATMRVTKG